MKKITTNKILLPCNSANAAWSLSRAIKPKFLGGLIYCVFYITFFFR